jgi:predicted ribosomally synthesized peptide with SipW-like signal peptide
MLPQVDSLQNRNVRIGLGVAVVVLALAAIGTGTYAAFLDTEKGPGGSTASGTLDLAVGSTGTTQLFSATNIAPGYTQDVTLSLKNAGSLPGTLTSKLAVSGAEVSCTEPEAEAEGVAAGACNKNGDLQNQMTVTVTKGTGSTATTTSAATVAQLVTTGLPVAGVVNPGATVDYTLHFVFPDLAGTENNKAQGDSITLSSDFLLTQS